MKIIPEGKKVNKEFVFTAVTILFGFFLGLLAQAGVVWAKMILLTFLVIMLVIGFGTLLYAGVSHFMGDLFIDK